MAKHWDDPLHERLLAWAGVITGRSDEPALRQEARPDHALARALEFAPGTRKRAAMKLVGRDGSSRRRLMARELEACGVRLVPMAYVDPVPGTTTRKFGGLGRYAEPMPAPVAAIDRAVRALYRRDPELSAVLRAEYCGWGPREERAGRLGISVRLYRDRLTLARKALSVLVEDEVPA